VGRVVPRLALSPSPRVNYFLPSLCASRNDDTMWSVLRSLQALQLPEGFWYFGYVFSLYRQYPPFLSLILIRKVRTILPSLKTLNMW
jgi:hypothetical protein